MLLLGMGMFMVSCSEGTADRQSDDNPTTGTDDPDGGTDNEDNPLIGTWSLTRMQHLYSTGEILFDYSYTDDEYWVFDRNEISLIYKGEEPETVLYYTFDGEIISITDTEGYIDECEVVSVTDTEMTLRFDTGPLYENDILTDITTWTYREFKKKD